MGALDVLTGALEKRYPAESRVSAFIGESIALLMRVTAGEPVKATCMERIACTAMFGVCMFDNGERGTENAAEVYAEVGPGWTSGELSSGEGRGLEGLKRGDRRGCRMLTTGSVTVASTAASSIAGVTSEFSSTVGSSAGVGSCAGVGSLEGPRAGVGWCTGAESRTGTGVGSRGATALRATPTAGTGVGVDRREG